MSNEIQPFEFEGSQVRTAQDDNGNPLFCGTDVAQALGYANPAKAVIDHCKGFLFWKPLETAGGIQQVRFISEGDMYRLITSSKLPAAERFEKWVYDEVLPSIRKHGAYMTQQTLDKALTSPDFLIQLATKLKEEQEKVKELEPKAKALDDFTNVEGAKLIRDAAKILSNAGTPIGRSGYVNGWPTMVGFTGITAVAREPVTCQRASPERGRIPKAWHAQGWNVIRFSSHRAHNPQGFGTAAQASWRDHIGQGP